MLNNIKISYKLLSILVLISVGLMSIIYMDLMNLKSNLYHDRKEKTMGMVEVAHSVLKHFGDKVISGEMSDEEAKFQAMESVKHLRYENGKQYFWINDLHPNMIMHPYKPQLDGKDISGVKDPNGKKLFVEMAKVVKSKGEGFVEYMWPRPGAKEPAPKVSYVKGYEKWGWVVGSGIYIDDVEKVFQENLKKDMLFGGAILLVILILGTLISRSITVPVQKITKDLDILSEGRSVDVERVSRSDEIGGMTNALYKLKQGVSENVRLKLLVDDISTPIIVCDRDYKVIYQNKYSESNLGKVDFDNNVISGGIIGKEPSFMDENLAASANLFAKSEELPYKREIQIGDSWVEVKVDKLTDVEGNFDGFYINWENITDKVRADESEKQSQKEINNLVQDASKGKLDTRINSDKFDGFYRSLSDSMNGLLDTVVKPINSSIETLGYLANGDLTHKMEGDYEGAFAEIKDSLNNTIDKFKDTMEQIEKSSHNVSSTSSEISSSTADLSRRTESQAASLEETSASMRDLTSKVHENSSMAREADTLSKEAYSVASSGGEIVEKTIDAMSNIEESSSKITEIINVIDEIAFQTNLLALNAAVEAARAGDAGKGFAVVADEVRALAGRSANASKEIKNLIDSSGEYVSQGSDLVARTGEIFNGILTSVNNVTEIMSQISSSSSEQDTSINEVSSAIGHMDQTTQQNAAMVEENTAASASMSEQADKLRGLISFFKIS